MNAEFRRQIGKWTREAMVRKAKAGHVTGGRVFGYDNVPVTDDSGRRLHVALHVNEREAEVVRRIFALCAAGTGYTRMARQLNAEQAPAPRAQQQRRAGWSPSTIYEVLHRPLYRGEIVWNKTRKRDAEGKTAVTSRPEEEWLRVDRPELRIVSDDAWAAAHRRLKTARVQYERVTHGHRRPHRDRDSKYLLTGFGRCALCGGGLHVRSRSHGQRRAFFYACTSHYNRGPEVCSHVDQWPMDEIDQELLGTIAGDVLSPELADEVIAAARQMFEASARPDRQEQLRRDLASVEREQARVTEAVATGGAIPILVERLRTTEVKRRELVAQLERARKPRQPAPAWRDIERRMRGALTDWRSRFTGDVARARQGFRQLLTTPIVFTPFVDQRGFQAIRFEGRVELEAVFGGMVTKLASPTGVARCCGPDFRKILQAA